MKAKKTMIALLLAAIPFVGFAQEWDDIYANPSDKRVDRMQKAPESQTRKVVVVQGDANTMRVEANDRDIDAYNRRTSTKQTEDTVVLSDNQYEDYQYTDRIIRFHDPESSVKIQGADDVIVYVGDDLYADYYANRGPRYSSYWGWNSYYPWYDTYYDPWFYSGWYDPWYYSWRSPWSYSRWYSPWYYSSWYSPYYFNSWTWYDPWYYGNYYGFYGGYSTGFYDGYHSSLKHNRSGRSSGVYRTSSANRANALARTSAIGRSSSNRSAISGSNRTSSYTRGANNGATYNRGTGSHTRIIDNSGRVYDARTGNAINRTRTSTYNRSTSNGVRQGSYNTRSTTPNRTYSRSSNVRNTTRTSPSRSYSVPSRTTTTRSSSYNSSSSRSSSSFSTGSSSRSTSSGSSGRSSGGRR